MSEQADSPVTPLPGPEPSACPYSRGKSATSEVEHGGERRQRRRGRAPAELRLLLDPEPEPEPEPTEVRKKPASMMRPKPTEQLSPMLTLSDFEAKFDRKKPQPNQLSKANSQYHKIFKEVGREEPLKQSYTCALQRDILYQGKMFLSDNWICFHSKVFGRDTKISIPVTSVMFIRKTKTALLVPNALVIGTGSTQHVFVSFLSRNTTFKLLKSICLHLEMDKTGSSPVTSSCENSFRGSCVSPLPLDFSDGFPDLDGVLQKRRQNLAESSSSGSQTPDYEKMRDFTGLPEPFLNREVSVHADIHLQTPSQKHGAALKNGPSHGSTLKGKASQTKSFHILLVIYLFLVSVLFLSSCYMGFKIVALEQRLNSLLSMDHHIHSENPESRKSQDEVNAEMYGELSTNLFKLDKIQRNLRKLLDET
uniref:GRAM domain-containing protein n=1 Tax=Oryzias latipes TaxID=8090 RepID=A0A3P9IIN1_ORYLA